MNCPECGVEIRPNEVFCGECGARVGQKRGFSVILLALGAIVVVVVCCLLGIILALLGFIALPGLTPSTPTPTPPLPTSTPRPTATPRPTETPQPTSTPAPSATSTAVPSPTRSTITEGGMKTYSNAQYGYSLQYPADWILVEGGFGPVFTSPKPLAGATIGAIPGASALGSEKAITDLFTAQLKGTFQDIKVVSEDTRTFNGVVWHYLIVTASYSGLDTKWDLYAKIHTNGTGYVFVGYASTITYDEQSPTFTRMMETFTLP